MSVHVYARAEPGDGARVATVLPFSAYESLTVRFAGAVVELPTGEQFERAIAEIRYLQGGRYDLDDEKRHGGVYLWLEDDGRALSVELEIRHRFVAGRATGNTWRWFEYEPTSVSPELRAQVRTFEPNTEDGFQLSIVDRGRIAGGPFIAAGGAILDANPARGRIGWEHTYPYSFLYYSAALETDFTEEFTIVPAVEITHGHRAIFSFLPCAGFGIGVPVQVLPEPRPGLRAQASLSWPVFRGRAGILPPRASPSPRSSAPGEQVIPARPLSFLTTFDWLMQLPPTASGRERPTAYKLAFLGQFSF